MFSTEPGAAVRWEHRSRPVADTRSKASRTARALLAGPVLLVAWGALAFGAVYPWAYKPLMGAATVLGAAAFLWAGSTRLGAAARHLILMLLLVGAGATLQLVPLPEPARRAVSPATESFLREHDVPYAAALALRQQAASLAEAFPVPRRPLSLDPAGTRRAILMLLALTVLFAGLTRLFARTGVARLLPWLMGLGVLVALIGIVQKATLGDDAWSGMKIYGLWAPRYRLTTPFGPFVNKNHYAGWMLMILPLGIAYFLAMAEAGLRHVRRDWRSRLLWLSSPEGGRLQLAALSVAVMGGALALTRSRSGIACFAAAMLCAGAFGLRSVGTARARAALGTALVGLTIAPFAWADADVARRFSSGRESIQLRLDAWRDAVTIVREFPLVGTGLNTYATATRKYQTTQKDMHFREAHNDYLQVAAEGGLLLGLPAAAALVLLVAGVRRGLRDPAPDRLEAWARIGAVTGLIAIGLQSFVEFSLQMPGNAVLFVVLCAAALHAGPTRGAPRWG